jgi:hypothetical protein
MVDWSGEVEKAMLDFSMASAKMFIVASSLANSTTEVDEKKLEDDMVDDFMKNLFFNKGVH